ncbi:MAG: hypothetical protein Q9181_006819 [Wetmoreana brouardii]
MTASPEPSRRSSAAVLDRFKQGLDWWDSHRSGWIKRDTVSKAAEKKIRLPEGDPKLFPNYILWIYNQGLTLRDGIFGRGFDLDGWCRLFVLAEKLGSEALQNLAVDKVCQYTANGADAVLESNTVNFVWDATLPDSVLRKILVDLVAYEIYVDEKPDLVNATPNFLYDVLKVCTRRLPGRLRDEVAPFDKNEKEKCEDYHVHRTDDPCPHFTEGT